MIMIQNCNSLLIQKILHLQNTDDIKLYSYFNLTIFYYFLKLFNDD
jgi:hypothetical protein